MPGYGQPYGFVYGGYDGLEEAPEGTCEEAVGLGLWVSRQEAFGQTTDMQGRIIFDDPDNPGTLLVGPPIYQMVLVKKDGGTPDYYAILHSDGDDKHIIKSLNYGEDPHVSAAHTTFLAQGAMNTGQAMCGLWHSTEGLVVIVAEDVTGTDGLSLSFFKGVGPHASAGADIAATDLGFTAPQGAANTWISFVAREDSDGNIIVLGLRFDASAHATPGGDDAYVLETFVLDPTVASGPAAVVTEHVAVDTDEQFEPHQLAEGSVLSLQGGGKTEAVWVVGRFDPERRGNQSTARLVDTVEGRAPSHGMSNVGGEGIWICETPDTLSGWRRVFTASVGQAQAPVEHIRNDSTGVHHKDLGLCFDESWQRLTHLGIDQDPSQDPLGERPEYST